MSLAEIKKYIKERGRVSLEEMSILCNTDLETMRGILGILLTEEKASLRKQKSCGKCSHCICHTKKQYRWLEDTAPRQISELIH